MSQDWNDLAGRLNASLSLAAPPIAISFRAGPVDGIAAFDAPMPAPLPDGRTGRVPAGCVFWMHAAESTFGTVAEDHGNCSVGSLTHGFKTLDEVAGNSDVAALLDTGWVTMDIVPQIPVVTEKPGDGRLRAARRDHRSTPTSCCCASTPSSSWSCPTRCRACGSKASRSATSSRSPRSRARSRRASAAR